MATNEKRLSNKLIWTRFTGFTHFIRRNRRMGILELIQNLMDMTGDSEYNSIVLDSAVDENIIKEILSSDLLFSYHEAIYRVLNMLFSNGEVPREVFAFILVNYYYKEECPYSERLDSLENVKITDPESLSLGILHDVKYVCEICENSFMNKEKFKELSNLLDDFRDGKLNDTLLVELIDSRYFKRKFYNSVKLTLKNINHMSDLKSNPSYGVNNDPVKLAFITTQEEKYKLQLQVLVKAYKKRVEFNYKLGSKNFLEKFKQWSMDNEFKYPV